MRRLLTKLFEKVVVTVLITGVCFLTPMVWSTCTSKPVVMKNRTQQVGKRSGAAIPINRSPSRRSLSFREAFVVV